MKSICIIILLLLSGQAFAQHPYSYSFNERHGFPINEIYYLHQDKKGNIWIGCNDGIFRYNSIAIKQFTHPRQNSRSISHILEDKYGRIWCQNFTRQIFCIERDSMRFAFDASKYTPANPSYDIDDQGNLFVGGQGAFYVLNSRQELKKVQIPANAIISELFHTREGAVLALADKLYKWQDGRTIAITKTNRPDILARFGGVRAKFEYRGDRLLMLTEINEKREYYLSELIADSIAITVIPADIAQGRVYNINPLQDGRIWLNTQNGTICLDSAMQPVYNGKFFFPGNNVSDVIMDMEGNYWVATLESGIHIIPNIGIWQYTRGNSKLSDNNVTSLYVDNSGLYIGYFNGMVDVVRYSQFERKLFNSNNQYRVVEKIDRRSPKAPLFICHGKMSCYDISARRERDLSQMRNIKDFVYVSDNKILFASNTAAGTFTINRGDVDTLSYIRREASRCVAYDSASRLSWVGYTDGTYSYDRANAAKELLYNGSKVYAACMKQTADSVLWIGTVTGDLLKVKGAKVVDAFPEQRGLHGKNIRVIYSSGKDLWVGTEKGLNVIDVNTGKVTYIDKHDGLPTAEINDIVINDNLVYLATTNGLFVFSQFMNHTNSSRPAIIVDKLSVNDKEHPGKAGLNLSSRQNKIAFYFMTIGLGEKYEYSYHYKLEGYDTSWQYTSQNVHYVNYSSLPPGDYVFYAKTVNEDGISSTLYKLPISIDKPVWQRIWFYLLTGLAGALLVSLIFLARIRALKQRSKLEQLIRSSELTALKAQMNPHFVFNALNSIQDLVLRNDVKNSNLYLGRFSELMRKVLEASGKEAIPLQQEIDILALYLDLEKLRFGEQFTYTLETDPSVDTTAVSIPAMIIQPFIENAIKHGLLHKEGQKQLSVRFDKQGEDCTHIICTIADNGVGRKKAMEIRQRNSGMYRESFAIKATQKRLDILNSYYKEKIGLQITDLYHEGTPSGTMVQLLIPCEMERLHEPI